VRTHTFVRLSLTPKAAFRKRKKNVTIDMPRGKARIITSNRPLTLSLTDGTTALINRYPTDVKMPSPIRERRIRANLLWEINISSVTFYVSSFHLKAKLNYNKSDEKSKITSEKRGAMLNEIGFFSLNSSEPIFFLTADYLFRQSNVPPKTCIIHR